jgi:hypothetical protein
MTPPSGQPAADHATAQSNAGLCCPQCAYNLTGLTENRCPECGTQFDPDDLRRILDGAPMPVPGWDDHSHPSFAVCFLRTCRMTWFHPAEFGRRFPWSHDAGAALRFWLTTRGAATLVMGTGVLAGKEIWSRRADWPLAFLIPVLTAATAAVCSLLCEIAINLLLGLLVKPKLKPRPVRTLPNSVMASSSWWGFVGFYSSFLLLTAVVLALDLSAQLGPLNPKLQTQERLVAALEVGPLLWWSWALGSGIAARAVPGLGVFVVRCLIPIIGAASFCLGRFVCCRP